MTQQYNALKHGMFSKATLLPFENKRQYQRFRRNVVTSLCCENDLQTERAYSIADAAWRLERLKKQICYREKSIFDNLTPQMVCAFAGVPEDLHSAAPDFLCNLQHKIKRAQVDTAYEVVTQYQHCHANFSTIPNLVAVFKQYPDLFDAANELVIADKKRPIISSATQTMDAAWQKSTAVLWQYLEDVYKQAYFIYQWKTIQKNAAPWVESWYYLKESEDQRLSRHKELQLKMQADFRKELSAFAQLKKNQWLFSKALLELGGHSQPSAALPLIHTPHSSHSAHSSSPASPTSPSNNAAIHVKGVRANIALGTIALPMGQIHANSIATANVSSQSIQH